MRYKRDLIIKSIIKIKTSDEIHILYLNVKRNMWVVKSDSLHNISKTLVSDSLQGSFASKILYCNPMMSVDLLTLGCTLFCII